MIYNSRLIELGLTQKEATSIMKQLYRSTLTSIRKRASGIHCLPVICFNEKEVIDFLKTKKHLDYVQKFLEIISKTETKFLVKE
jgi:hypothetical protein